jgi:hypothetical protein
MKKSMNSRTQERLDELKGQHRRQYFRLQEEGKLEHLEILLDLYHDSQGNTSAPDLAHISDLEAKEVRNIFGELGLTLNPKRSLRRLNPIIEQGARSGLSKTEIAQQSQLSEEGVRVYIHQREMVKVWEAAQQRRVEKGRREEELSDRLKETRSTFLRALQTIPPEFLSLLIEETARRAEAEGFPELAVRRIRERKISPRAIAVIHYYLQAQHQDEHTSYKKLAEMAGYNPAHASNAKGILDPYGLPSLNWSYQRPSRYTHAQLQRAKRLDLSGPDLLYFLGEKPRSIYNKKLAGKTPVNPEYYRGGTCLRKASMVYQAEKIFGEGNITDIVETTKFKPWEIRYYQERREPFSAKIIATLNFLHQKEHCVPYQT